jgi:farnesyl diphosphate synthase
MDLERFTLERYKAIVKYKTAYYSFYLPVACGLILAGIADEAALAQCRDILLTMGEYFQVQDDYLDAYADAETLGKIGTDIQDAKCSWLVVQALARSTPEQKAALKANYGRHDAAAVAAVKALYAELGLEEVFRAYEAASYEQLTAAIKATCAHSDVPEAVFLALLHKIYKRNK